MTKIQITMTVRDMLKIFDPAMEDAKREKMFQEQVMPAIREFNENKQSIELQGALQQASRATLDRFFQ